MSGTCVEPAPQPAAGVKLVACLARFFASFRFALLALALLAALSLWLLLMLVMPGGDSGMGAFADEFRAWCFGYDPATGELAWSYVVMLFLDPLVLGLLIAALWRAPLREHWAEVKRLALPALLGGLGAVATASLAVVAAPARTSDELPFPAEALRTQAAMPQLDLTNQDGARVGLADLRGHVVVVTGIYAACNHTCPVLMGQAKRALAALSPAERASVRVLAVTLNPELDTQQVLRGAATRYEVSSPELQFLGGDPAHVNRVLDALQITRRKDPHSGVIDHANLFVLVDKRGRIAYRLTIGERQERWLISALRLLAGESAAGGA
jgi:cytochrome oxidase Cu insertion factor (SCO1/SenC/PrrC family)